MEIPLESSIAVHTLEKRAQEKAEQQELKKLVLDYEHREQVNEKQGLFIFFLQLYSLPVLTNIVFVYQYSKIKWLEEESVSNSFHLKLNLLNRSPYSRL